jgi:hypothetical protein
MSELAEHSLLKLGVESATTVRYSMLESIREYAAGHLRSIGQRVAVADRHAAHFTELVERAASFRRGPLEPAWARELEAEFSNLRAAHQWTIESGQAEIGLRLVVALVDDVLLRGRFEIGRWAEDVVRLSPTEHQPLRCAALGLAANAASAEGRYDDALSLSTEALTLGGTTAAEQWLALNVVALLRAAGLAEGPWQELFDEMVTLSDDSGDPFPGAVARFLRVLLYAYDGRGELASDDADALLETAVEQANPSLMAMGLLSSGRTVAASDPARARQEFQQALSCASSARSAVLVEQAQRAIVELDARSGDRAGALASLRSITRRFMESGDLSQQMQTVMSMLDSLVAMGALAPAATICGALARTPWRLTSTYRRVDRALVAQLGTAEYASARRAGSMMQPTDIVAFAARLAQELTDDDSTA